MQSAYAAARTLFVRQSIQRCRTFRRGPAGIAQSGTSIDYALGLSLYEASVRFMVRLYRIADHNVSTASWRSERSGARTVELGSEHSRGCRSSASTNSTLRGLLPGGSTQQITCKSAQLTSNIQPTLAMRQVPFAHPVSRWDRTEPTCHSWPCCGNNVISGGRRSIAHTVIRRHWSSSCGRVAANIKISWRIGAARTHHRDVDS